MNKEQDFNSKSIKPLKDRLKELNIIMFAVIIVLLIGFVSLLITVWGLVIAYQRDTAQSYQEYTNQLRSSNDKVDTLIHELQNKQ